MRALLATARTNLAARLTWRGDWVLALLANTVTAVAGLAIIWALYRHSDLIAGHPRSDALLVWGFALGSQGAFWMLFGGVFVANQRYLVGGELDRLLLRPVDPLAQLLLEHLRPEHAPTLLVGIIAIVGTLASEGRADPLAIALIPIQILLGSALMGGILLLVASVGFWMQHRGSATGLVSQMAGYSSYPLSFLPGPLALLLVTLVPFAFTATAPATLFMETARWPWLWALQPLVCGGAAVAGVAAWRLSMHRYSSSGS